MVGRVGAAGTVAATRRAAGATGNCAHVDTSTVDQKIASTKLNVDAVTVAPLLCQMVCPRAQAETV